MVGAENIIRVSFLACALFTVLLFVIKPLQRFLSYGAREPTRPPSPGQASKAERSLMERLGSVRVPHAWFQHFYWFSVYLSGIWLQSLLFTGWPSQYFVERSTVPPEKSMTKPQVILAWTMLAIQGSRRCVESTRQNFSSKSTMWIGHYFVGLAFYFGASVAVWIEGAPVLRSQGITMWDLTLQPPSMKTLTAVPLFLLASGAQWDCHAYMNDLKKYTLPEHPYFQIVVCPHYLAECIIYISISLATAPPGQTLNKTVLTIFIFSVVNLGITADGTKKWYMQKFGESEVTGRYRMIPYIW